ncbi:sensor histidine kinase [Actinomadura nitritigenes]|uniref:sensor histidine kinase n=1 Tax=Actinomadura nitritigenes TaxID=134602 RepID=UPI003D8D2F21
MSGNAEELPQLVARAMMWLALGLLVTIRLLIWVSGNVSAEGMALTAASYPPLVAILLRQWRLHIRYLLLGAVVMLALLPFAVVGTAWDWLPWTVTAAVLCVLPAKAAWPLFGFILVATAAGGVLLGEEVTNWFWRVSATGIDGVIVFSLYTLATMVGQLHAARGEKARLATIQERLRVDGELRGTVQRDLGQIASLLRRGAIIEVREAAEVARRVLARIRATASEYRTGPQDTAVPLRSSRLPRFALLGVLILQGAKTLVNVAFLPTGDPRWALLFAPWLAGFTFLIMGRPSRVRLTLVGLFAVPVAWPGDFLVPVWDSLGAVWGFFIGAALAWARPPRSWLVVAGMFTLHTVAFFFPPPVPSGPVMAASLISDLLLAWVVYSLSRLADLVGLLERAQHELAQEAVARERARIARDLHDVLGFSLSAVALRSELVLRLKERDPSRARTEQAALLELVDRARGELGSIASGQIRLRLHREFDSVIEALAAADVTTDTHVETGPLPAEVDTALAAALRESVTNVLRHSRARNCEISIIRAGEVIRLRVANDGVRDTRPEPGTGLASLAERTGGSVWARRRPGGRFELTVEFRLDPTGFGSDADGVDPVASAQLGGR